MKQIPLTEEEIQLILDSLPKISMGAAKQATEIVTSRPVITSTQDGNRIVLLESLRLKLAMLTVLCAVFATNLMAQASSALIAVDSTAPTIYYNAVWYTTDTVRAPLFCPICKTPITKGYVKLIAITKGKEMSIKFAHGLCPNLKRKPRYEGAKRIN